MQRNKSIVIYFSHTGENWILDGITNITKGNTEVVAEKIQDITEADLFKVEPIDEYPYSYSKCCEVAKGELNNNYRPKLKNYLKDIDKYDTVYIGSPVWYGHLAMPMFTQLEKLDFNGKSVKLFVTHEGSEFGECTKDIQKLCKGANIQDGIAIQGSTVYNCDTKLNNWISNG